VTTTGPLVWIDGEVLDAGHARVSANDHGLLLGDGCFETLAVTDGRPRLLERHLRRLRRALSLLEISGVPSDEQLRAAIDELVAAHGTDAARVRVTVTPGPGASPRHRGDEPLCIVSITALPPRPGPARLTLTDWVRNERSPLAGIKSTSWSENAMILREVAAAGFDNALLCDSAGRLSECTTASIFLVIDGVILTPSLATGCLPGIIREVLLDADVATEADLHPTDLDGADEVFMTSAVHGVVPVMAVEHRVFPLDGEHTRRAMALVDSAR